MIHDPLVDEGLAIVRDLLGLLHVKMQTLHPGPSVTPEIRSLRRWQIYLSTLILEIASASGELAPLGYARGMAILNRSVFEYVAKSKFFYKNVEIAHQQARTIPIRNLAMLEKAVPDREQAENLSIAYDAWVVANDGLNEFAGNKKLHKMHLAVVAPERILHDDRKNIDYTREYHNFHDVPSQVVHGEATLMTDVFDDLDDDLNFNLHLRSRIFTIPRELTKLMLMLAEFLVLMWKNLTPIPELEAIEARIASYRERADIR